MHSTLSFTVAVGVFSVALLLVVVGFARSLRGQTRQRRTGSKTPLTSKYEVIGRFPRWPEVPTDVPTVTRDLDRQGRTSEARSADGERRFDPAGKSTGAFQRHPDWEKPRGK